MNLAELYFDNPVGKTNPEDFTPLNSIVRSDYRRQTGMDPIDFFRKESRNYWGKNAAGWKRFVDYRLKLERDLNERFIRLIGKFRDTFSPDLHIVLTYVDNIYDPSMREAVGADVRVMFELLERYSFTLVLEDPGTVWHLGPRRYAELAQTYSKMTPHAGCLGIDINIVGRDVKTYPTQKQTGTEFLELFRQAGRHFQTVMVYSEKTMLPQDANLVSNALASNTHGEMDTHAIRTESSIPIIYRSGLKQADFEVDGKAWPCVSEGDVSLPAGLHILKAENSKGGSRPRLIKLNGDLVSARYGGGLSIEFSYITRHRAIAVFSSTPESLQVDNWTPTETQTAWVRLPRGSHKIRISF